MSLRIPNPLSALDDLVRAAAQGNDLPGVTVAVVCGDAVAAVAAAGEADLDRHTPMTEHGICNWFSMTKIATATAAMILADAGSLDINAPVGSYLGEIWPAKFAPVRVRHLLSHSSGLRNPIPVRWVHRPGEPTPDPAAFLTQALRRQRRLRFKPGACAAYTNIGYLAAGQVIASVAGQTYVDFVSEEVLAPLQMTRTTFSWSDPKIADQGRVVAYQRLARPFVPIAGALLPPGLLGTRHGKLVALDAFELDGAAYGGLIGPVEDAARGWLHFTRIEASLAGPEYLALRASPRCRRSLRRDGLTISGSAGSAAMAPPMNGSSTSGAEWATGTFFGLTPRRGSAPQL